MHREKTTDIHDKELFEMIYTKYADDIFRRIHKILENQRDSEDAAQETWTYVLEHIEIFRGKPDRSVRSYIFSVAKNQAISLIRKRRREEKLLCDLDCVEVADETTLFELCAERDDGIVLRCILELGEPYSSVLTYYYLHHHTLKEISKIMRLKESTVGSRLTRGRRRLISLLKRRGIHD